MLAKKINKVNTHVVDILGNVKGRDQPIMLMEKAHELVSTLPKELFLDNEVVFFDPFCKAGEILLACAFNSCIHKSKNGNLHDIEKIQKELYQSKKYFGLAPDKRHHRLSLRTFLGNENSHKEEFNHIIKDGNYLSEEDGKLDKEKYQKEFDHMIDYIKKQTGKKKIIAVGNPPYQEEDGGAQKSARPIYQIFTESLIDNKLIDSFVLVIPARWFGAGKGLDKFREKMMNDKSLRSIKYYEKSGEVFPTVDIDGGICFIFHDKKYFGKTEFIAEDYSIDLQLKGLDIIPDDPLSLPILRKIIKISEGLSVFDIAFSRKAFDLSTNYFEENSEASVSAVRDSDAITCVVRNREEKSILKSSVKKNNDLIRQWKVCIPKAYGGKKGQRRKTLPAKHIFLLKPDQICTETYNIVGAFERKDFAVNCMCYLKTNFARYLLGLRKLTQDIPKDRWKWVPLVDFDKKWTDELLYSHFNLTKKEINHINKKLKEWS